MKKLLLIIAVLISTINSKGQITLDTIVPTMGFYVGTLFKTVQISETETKYFYADTNNTFSLYNMDWTPFISNVQVPLPFSLFDYQCLYITRTLFDCDSSNIEYLFTCPAGGCELDRKLYVMRTDGTQLLMLDSSYCQFCFGACLGGSDWVKPIVSTSDGAKMFVIKTRSSDVSIYSLCGNLPTDMIDISGSSNSFVKLYPNPSSNSLTFEVNPPDNKREYDLVIFDNQSQVLRREKFEVGNYKRTIDLSELNSGSYFYSLCTKNKAYQTGKFLLTR